MDLSLTPEQIAIQKEARRFFEAEVMPHARAVDRGEKSVFDAWPKIAAQGYMAAHLPEEYGGAGADGVTASLIGIEMARACGATVLSQGASILLCGGAILAHGTEAQKKQYLPPLARGEKLGCWGLTEPAAGSDAAGILSTAREVDGGYVLNGAKTFITNAPNADTFVVYAWTDPRDGHRGMSAFILERGMKGLTTSAPMHKMGFRGSPTGEIFMSDCFVPAESLLGTKGLGFYEATDGLNAERAMAPCIAIGFMERCLELCLRYTRERHAFGRPLAAFQAMQLKMARMYIDIELSRSILWRLIHMRERGESFIKEASAAKVFCGEAATRHALEAVQIHGGYGYMEEFDVERIARDSKLLEIGAGTTEIQLLLIARMLTGELSESTERRPAAAAASPAPTPVAKETAPSVAEAARPDCRALLRGMTAAYQPDGAPGWHATIMFKLSGPTGGVFRLVVDGATCRLEEGDGAADTTVEASDETWAGILMGTESAQKAFFTGKLKVHGAMANAMTLSSPKVFRRPERKA